MSPTKCCDAELVLQQEQEEYKREGIQWEHIDYFNNVVICQLIEQQHKGIIAMMDEACLNVGKVTDSMLLEEMDRKLKTHAHYTSRRTDPMNKLLSHSEDFLIKHYAGDVVYTVGGFIEKNRDTLFQVKLGQLNDDLICVFRISRDFYSTRATSS